MGNRNKIIKDKGKSIRNRLLNISREASYDYNLMLTRYVQERMLYRLSQSKYKDSFCLKGGALLYAHNQLKSRPTIDIDFLAKDLNNDKEHIKSLFTEILSFPDECDALTFNGEDITVDDIMEGKNYHGVCVTTKELDSDSLAEAIKATFENRRTTYADNHVLFTDDFFLDKTKNDQWNAFIRKIKYKDALTFSDVGKVIQEKMKPYWQAI